METNAHGVRISYDDLGRGEPALLMMPGWCANRTMFKHLAPQASASRRTLALDWRGHGQSGVAPADFGERDLVNDALAVIEASGAESIIPVATAHSGWVALELRRRLGSRVPKLVLLDWIILEAPAPFVAALQAFQDPAQWESAREQLFSASRSYLLTVRLLSEQFGNGERARSKASEPEWHDGEIVYALKEANMELRNKEYPPLFLSMKRSRNGLETSYALH